MEFNFLILEEDSDECDELDVSDGKLISNEVVLISVLFNSLFMSGEPLGDGGGEGSFS